VKARRRPAVNGIEEAVAFFRSRGCQVIAPERPGSRHLLVFPRWPLEEPPSPTDPITCGLPPDRGPCFLLIQEDNHWTVHRGPDGETSFGTLADVANAILADDPTGPADA
jgi:hypothetical protein